MQIIVKLTEQEAIANCEQIHRENFNLNPEDRITVEIQRQDIPNYEFAKTHKAFMTKFALDVINKLNIQRPLLYEIRDAAYSLLQ